MSFKNFVLFSLFKKIVATALIALIVHLIFNWDKKDKFAISPENQKKLDILLEKKISTAEERFSRAEERFILGDLKGSIEDYEDAEKLNPKLSGIHFKKGFVKFKFAELKWNYRVSIANPKNADKFGIQKILEQKIIDYESVIKDFDLALKSNPKEVLAYLYRGVCKSRLRLEKEAMADFNQVIQLDPKNSLAYAYRGLTKYVLNDFYGELQDYKKAIQLDPKNAEVYFYLGYTEYEYQKHKEAIEYFDQALKINPNYFQIYFFRASSKHAIGDMIGYKEDLNKFKENKED